MRKILLSMKPYWFEKIMSGEKIYEYRTRFANEELVAYIYVSQPVCAITGILHLGRKEYLQSWREEHCENEELVKRIDAYMQRGNKVVMPVLKYQHTVNVTMKMYKWGRGHKTGPNIYNRRNYVLIRKTPEGCYSVN